MKNFPLEELQPSLQAKRDRLLRLLAEQKGVLVAFSGGLDSSVLARAAVEACGRKAAAVTCEGPTLPKEERKRAVETAALIGIRHLLVPAPEIDLPEFVLNRFDRCYVCKRARYLELKRLAEQWGGWRLVDGVNADDFADYRPGLKAAKELNVLSPLAEVGLTKNELRTLARHWHLPVWNLPASPCLATRVAYGVELTPQRLQRIEQAERFLKTLLKVEDLRVRCEFNELARLELPEPAFAQLFERRLFPTVAAKLHELGFNYVTLDLDGLRSGSLNLVLPPEQRRRFEP